jgi:autotransporter-associated beta strand protein
VNTNGRVQFAGGFSNYTGTVNVGTNATIEIRQPGSFGTDLAGPTVNLNGSRSRLMLRHYQNGDWNLDVNANGKFAEIYAGRLDSYGLGSQGIYSIKSLTATANNYLTLTGDNSNWVTVNGPVTAAGNTVLVTNSNAMFRQGGTVGGFLDKRGPSVLAIEGPLAVAGKTVIQQGWIDLRGANGKLTGSTGIEVRGGNLMLSNNVETGSDPNRIAGIPISLGGGSIRVVGTTNLGPITLAPGTSEINYAMDTQSGITPLVINDVGATRAIGSQLRVNSTFGTIGAPTNTGTNPRIHVTGMADNFGTGAVGNVDIIPYMVFSNNFEFVAYRSTSDAGQPLGLVQVTNGSMRADAADGTGAGQLRSGTAATEIMRFTGTATTALGGNATWRAIKMDGGATRTIDVGTNTLTVDRGHIIFVSNNNQRIGLNTGTGFLTSGNNELQITANQSTSLIGTVISNGPAGVVNLVKNGGGGLQFDGALDNTFTGNVHLNGGVLVNNRLGHVPAGATVLLQWRSLGAQSDCSRGNRCPGAKQQHRGKFTIGCRRSRAQPRQWHWSTG